MRKSSAGNETRFQFAVNSIKVLEDADIDYIRVLCENHNGWHIDYDKKSVKIWTKPTTSSNFDMIKARIFMDDVQASTAYDVLHDALYREYWDKYVHNATDIGLINPNNDMCYYAIKAMPPFRGRDFVLQRSWLDMGSEKFICSHSVCHEMCKTVNGNPKEISTKIEYDKRWKKYPPVKGYVRATVFLTAYLVREVGEGCQITYVTHADPKGKLPAWLSNNITKVLGPKVVKKLHKACISYPKWKNEHRPEWKPWLYPEQLLNAVRVDIADCVPRSYEQEIIDESYVNIKEMVQDPGDLELEFKNTE